MVTGSAGLIGSALKKFVQKTLPCCHFQEHLPLPKCAWVFLDRGDADLTNAEQTFAVFDKHRPAYVIHLAAFAVGSPNMAERSDELMRVNLAINENVVACARKFAVKKFVGALTHYAYPAETAQPMLETHVDDGDVITSAAGYAVPKRQLRQLLHQARAETDAQYFNVVFPCVYGPSGSMNADGPVVGAFIAKCFQAKQEGRKFTVQGSGFETRQFLYALDIPPHLLRSLFDFEEEVINFPAITGIAGQDGSYMAELLISKGYMVHGTLHVLEAIRSADMTHSTRFYQASTSELYGKVQAIPQNEETPFHPRSPYAVSKLGAFWSVVNYREAYNIFACNGILFNHESPRRGDNFVTRKITQGVARIKAGVLDYLCLGNLNAKRDWGHARDYVKAMWLILQHTEPADFVVGSGCTRTVREFCETAFSASGMAIQWEGEGVNEVGKLIESKQVVVRIDPQFFRPAEVDLLLSDPSRIREVLGWTQETSFQELVSEMVTTDWRSLQLPKDMLANGPDFP
ncbi:hypothetical protein CYMTET_8474 [Cymbomonas tetramitiformis]|uniref:GDP-mannose 4,6-dehydratase n=1 Tax=Cymbomonas tetramitiformis TaxID=36881 RepID=A0AAE0LFT5_9CHLO|nr:hypothetical protein CYMTET_8474 [Cymbomonas tetramitiformis]